jgi:hypothetical protein
VDEAGRAHVTGFTSSKNFPTSNAIQPKHGGGGVDAFVTKLTISGQSIVYSTFLGGSGPVEGDKGKDFGRGIAVDDAGGAWVTGTTASTDFPNTAGAFQQSLAGSFDAFVTKIADVHDLAVIKLKAPKRVTLTQRKPVVTKKVKVTIQNRSPSVEVIPDVATLRSFVTLELFGLAPSVGCTPPVPTLDTSKIQRKLPITLKPKKKLKLVFLVDFDCAIDPAKTTKKDPGHDDFRYEATVSHVVLDGMPDAHPEDDDCPRSVTPPFEIDPYPDGKIKDKGCGAKKGNGTFGADVITDVVVK